MATIEVYGRRVSRGGFMISYWGRKLRNSSERGTWPDWMQPWVILVVVLLIALGSGR